VSADVEAAYREHAGDLYGYLVRMSGDEDVADDVLQDTFERLLERAPLRGANLRGWLFRVATNRLRDAHRRSARRRRLLAERGGANAHSDPPSSPERQLQRSEAAAHARRILDALPERDRSILLMREAGFTHREIAEAVGTTTKSVGTLVARALDRVSAHARSMEVPR
jgi:RNA polymerase sigma-70 factor (ECF subfamily)